MYNTAPGKKEHGSIVASSCIETREYGDEVMCNQVDTSKINNNILVNCDEKYNFIIIVLEKFRL